MCTDCPSSVMVPNDCRNKLQGTEKNYCTGILHCRRIVLDIETFY